MPVPALSDIQREGQSAFVAGGASSFPASSAKWSAACDCLAPAMNALEDGYTYAVSGTGAAWTALATGADNAVGIARLALGTVATNRGSLAGTNFAAVALGGGAASFAGKARIVTLSSATATYSVRLGFIDNVTAESTDGVFFRYTHSVNGGRWQAVCRSNGVETVADTGITATANAWALFVIEINAAGTQAVFKVNGATVATVAASIPTGVGRETGYGLMALRTAGTTATNALDLDFLEAQVAFTTAR